MNVRTALNVVQSDPEYDSLFLMLSLIAQRAELTEDAAFAVGEAVEAALAAAYLTGWSRQGVELTGQVIH